LTILTTSTSANVLYSFRIDTVTRFNQLHNQTVNPTTEESNSHGKVKKTVASDKAFEAVSIFTMLQQLKNSFFIVEGRQEDAEEFLGFILNHMNDEMIELIKNLEVSDNTRNRTSSNHAEAEDPDEWQVIKGTKNKGFITRDINFGKSPISDIFYGKLLTRVYRENEKPSDNIEPFFTLKLVIDKVSSVYEALENMTRRDSLEGVKGKTKKEVTAYQQVSLEELPTILILHLRYFDFQNGCRKILKTVEFPLNLKLDPSKFLSFCNQLKSNQAHYFFRNDFVQESIRPTSKTVQFAGCSLPWREGGTAWSLHKLCVLPEEQLLAAL